MALLVWVSGHNKNYGSITTTIDESKLGSTHSFTKHRNFDSILFAPIEDHLEGDGATSKPNYLKMSISTWLQIVE